MLTFRRTKRFVMCDLLRVWRVRRVRRERREQRVRCPERSERCAERSERRAQRQRGVRDARRAHHHGRRAGALAARLALYRRPAQPITNILLTTSSSCFPLTNT